MDQIEEAPEQKAEKVIEEISSRFIRDSKAFEDAFNRVALDLRDTMRNLAIGSGALAAASLVLLSSNVQANALLVLAGIIILMFESALAFIWLLRDQNMVADRIMKQRYEELGPAAKILTSHYEYSKGEKTKEKFFEELNDYIKEHNDKTKNNHQLDQSKPKDRDNWDKVFMGVLVVGILLLALGLVAPHIGLGGG